MTTNRISGSPEPDPSRAAKMKDSTKQVEKVREIDPDEKAKQGKKFQKMLEKAEEEITIKKPRIPSPLEPEFHKLLGDAGASSKKAIPAPSYSAAPDVQAPMQEKGETRPEKLPKAKDFWNGVDLPDEPLQKPNLHEETIAAAPKARPKQEFEEPLQEPTSKKLLTEDKNAAPPSSAWPKEQGVAPSRQTRGREGRLPSDALPEDQGIPPSRHTRGKERSSEDFEKPTLPKIPGPEERESRKRHKQEEKTIEIIPPSSHPLPAVAQAAALSAVSVASPYLSPEVLPLFYQMVGSILVMMAPPGIQRTTIVLNARSFSKSKFYGSTIEIEKYSTAPDSLNIRLSGTDEAVATFNQHLPNLLDAFENGNFNFRIGRLDAVYSREPFNERS